MSDPSSGAAPRVSIVIPTWNGAHHLPTCLNALRDQGMEGVETLVVDNGSRDDTLSVLRGYPEVRVLALPKNLGFARGANAGIRAARGEILVLLNNDTEVAPGWLHELVAPFATDPRIGMTTSKLRLFDDRERLHTTGDTVDRAGGAANRGFGEHDEGQYDEALEVFGANAAAGAYRGAMLDEIGLFEAGFESYFEDVDLAWRARLAGWECRFVPKAVVFHHVSATGGGPYASYHVARNRLWTIARCMPIGLLWRNGHRIAAAQARITLDALRHLRGAAARATLRGQLVGLFTWPRWLAARRRIMAARRMDDDRLLGLLRAGEAKQAG